MAEANCVNPTGEAVLIPDEESREVLKSSDYSLAQLCLRTWPGRITQLYMYSCTICGKTIYESTTFVETPMLPTPPDKWKTSHNGSVYYCEKHEIKEIVLVDGKEIKR